MKTSSTFADTYPLQWLDLVCHETLNPAKNQVDRLSPQGIESLLGSFRQEFIDLQSHLKGHLMHLSSPKKIRAAVMQYHTAVLLLNKQASVNWNNYPGKNSLLKETG